MMTAAVMALVAWGALAFGAVYPWAYTPLLAGCALVGALGLLLNRTKPFPCGTGPATLALVVVLAAGLLQLVPLPSTVLRTISPSTLEFLQRYTVGYDDASHPLSLVPQSTAIGLAFLACFTLLLAGLTAALSRSGVRRLAQSLVAFGVLLALVGIIQKATLGEHAWGGMKIYGFWTPVNLLSTPFGPYVNKNHFAGWMLMGLPLALGFALGLAEQGTRHISSGWRSFILWFSSPEGGKLQLTLLAIVFMSASLLMTKSRSGVGGLAIAVLLVSVIAGRRFGSKRAGLAALMTLAILFVVVLGLADSDFTSRVTNRMSAVELRKNIWSDSAVVIRDFPLAGTGLNTFGTAMLTYQTVQHDQHFQEAHNDYLQLLVEGGMLIALPALAALVLIARVVYRRFASGEDDTLTYWIRVGATVGLVAVAAQAFLEFSLQMPGNAAMAVVLLAIALHHPPTRRRRSGGNAKRQTPKRQTFGASNDHGL
ncbi:MAG: O-antigen ligase family protein [Vicinamibacterales bacterium]